MIISRSVNAKKVGGISMLVNFDFVGRVILVQTFVDLVSCASKIV